MIIDKAECDGTGSLQPGESFSAGKLGATLAVGYRDWKTRARHALQED